MLINDKIRIESIWDHKHGQRFQLIVVNNSPGENFTVQKDLMTRDYLKMKLTQADVMRLIQELHRWVTQPELAQLPARNHLKVVKDEE